MSIHALVEVVDHVAKLLHLFLGGIECGDTLGGRCSIVPHRVVDRGQSAHRAGCESAGSPCFDVAPWTIHDSKWVVVHDFFKCGEAWIVGHWTWLSLSQCRGALEQGGEHG